jgi:hypothetical protein
MGKVHYITKMGRYWSVRGQMGLRMDLVDTYLRADIFILVLSAVELKMDLEFRKTVMASYLKESGPMIKNTDLEQKNGQMALFSRASFFKERKMAKDDLYGRMDRSTMGNFQLIKFMVLGYTHGRMVKSTQESG